jgi:hypothetical protein
MNQDNLKYLKNQVKFTGFGDALEFQLQENVEKQMPDFTLTHKPEYGKDAAEATLHFRQSEQGNYFFNKYDLAIEKEGADPLNQTFFVGKENTFTLKEAFNLMEGRAVNKEMTNKDKEAYTTWVKLDFSEADKNGNFKMKHFSDFDIKASIEKLPLKAFVNHPDNKQLIESLQKGNRQAVTMEHNGSEYKRSIEANPQFKSISMYDGDQKVKNQVQKKDTEQSEGITEGKQQSGKKTAKQDAGEADDAPAAPAEKKRKRRNQSVS